MILLVPDDVVADLETLLALGEGLDRSRAELVVELAMARVEAVVAPVPREARAIVLDVAVRGYTNPQGVNFQQVGPFSRSVQTPGVYLTEREQDELRRLAGVTGAFTIHPMRRTIGLAP